MSEQRSPSSAVPAWTLGWRLQRALAHAGMTTTDMATELGVARSTISRWVNDGGNQPPKAGFVKQWALRTGVPYQWLSTGEEPGRGPDTPGEQGGLGSRWNLPLTRACEPVLATVVPLGRVA